MELVCDSTNAESDMGIKGHNKTHRAAMKAALGIQTIDHPEEKQLLQRRGQSSVHEMALIA
jgi:hypothetical protein